MQQPLLTINLVAAQCHKPTDSQSMAVGEDDERGIPVAISANSAGRLDELIDLLRLQMLPGSAFAVR